jgi:hypothetical protein
MFSTALISKGGGMKIELVGSVNNILMASREMKKIYRRDYDTIDDGVLGPKDYAFMLERIAKADTRPVFMWLLDVVLDITATNHFWDQISAFTKEIRWVRKDGDDQGYPRIITEWDFEGPVPGKLLEHINGYIKNGEREKALEMIPDNFIKRGLAKCDYKTLRDLYQDRRHYRYGDWTTLCDIIEKLPYFELLTVRTETDFWQVDGENPGT